MLNFRNSFISKKAPKTINGIIQLLTAIINYSIKTKGLKIVNPCVGVPRLKTNDKRERFLSTNEIQTLMYEFEDEDLFLFTKLALCTGGRLETILHIQKKDIDIDNGFITLHDLKNDETYTGFLTEDIMMHLKEYLSTLNKNDYIVGGYHKKYPTRTISRYMKKVLDDLFNGGLDTKDSKNRVVIHTLRHTFASHLAINGIPIFTIQKLMNHKDIE